jgi:glycosyltransferase involved in cell wall biosynthesis
MIVSITHARGHGVAVVIDQQVSALVAHGHEVVLAGYCSPNDFTYGGRPVLEVHDPRSVATLALDLEVDIIVAHTPPFFGVTRWTGAFPPVISYDHGEPPPDLFSDAAARRQLNDIKDIELASSTAVYTNSQAVADEAFVKPRGVLPLGNSHLGRWDADAAARREFVRAKDGWVDRFVVLNVCRFGEGERRYKGVDTFAAIHDMLYAQDPLLASRAVFVLCGKGTEEDVAAMEYAGLEVRANVTDEEMSGLYAAADAYANFSLWEGYNLGIGQALAMGLPVVASDNPAHRAFGVSVCQGAGDAARLLAGIAKRPRSREPVIWEWKYAMELFVAAVEDVASEVQGPDTKAD